jgi:type II secretory pathway predicted ATPase ExeA
MNHMPFPYRDFVRVKATVLAALREQEETYVLVTGDTGTGKTALLRELRADLDRARYRVLYFSEARRLKAPGLVRLLAKALRVDTSMYHVVSFDSVVRALGDDTQRVLLWFDEAHDLPEETLAQARSLIESDLDGASKLQALLVGTPKLRSDLQAHPHLWRRIAVREEITGLQLDELAPFLEHHFGAASAKRFCEHGLALLFEHGKAAPGQVLPMAKRVFAAATGKGKIEPEQVEEVLQRWNLA